MKQKLTAWILLLCMVVLPLAGCGKEEIQAENTLSDLPSAGTEELLPEEELILPEEDILPEEEAEIQPEEETEDREVPELGKQVEEEEEIKAVGAQQQKGADRSVYRQKYYIRINRAMNTCTVYEKDEKGRFRVPVKAMVVSCGGSNTPLGYFKIGDQYRWLLMMGDVYSQYASRVTGHILIHSVPYYDTKNNTLLYNEYNKLGNMASHGCIRMTHEDSRWIMNNCGRGTGVTIYDNPNYPGPLGKPVPPKIPTANKTLRWWDPTDVHPDNPWHKIEKPTISGIKSHYIELGRKFNPLQGVRAADSFGKSLTKQVQVSGKVNYKKAGKYRLTYTVSDAYGNETSKRITIGVRDTTPPKISLSLQDGFSAESVKAGCSALRNGFTPKDYSEIDFFRVYLKLKNTETFTETEEIILPESSDTSSETSSDVSSETSSETSSGTSSQSDVSSDTTSSQPESSSSEVSSDTSSETSSAEETPKTQTITHTYIRYTYRVKAVATDIYGNSTDRWETLSFVVEQK